MKKLLFLVLVIMFTGCSEEEKTCSLNGAEVGCATLTATGTPAPITATANAAYEIDFDAMTFEILERGNDITEDANGNSCEITVDPGFFNITYKEESNIIEFSTEGSSGVVKFQKISEGDGFYGTWKNLDSETQEVVTFRDDGTAEFSLTCHF